MLSVEDIMTREPYTLRQDNSLSDAIDLMREHHIRHVPVVNGHGDLVGIVSHRDVLAASEPRASRHDDGRQDRQHGDGVRLNSIMSTPVHTVDVSADLRGVASYLRRQRIGCVPVTRSGQLVGVISDSDFLDVAMTLMEQLELGEPEEEF